MMSHGSALAGIIAARGCPDRHSDAVADRLRHCSTYLSAQDLTEEIDKAIAFEIAEEYGALRTPADQALIDAAKRWHGARLAALLDPTLTPQFIAAIVNLARALSDEAAATERVHTHGSETWV